MKRASAIAAAVILAALAAGIAFGSGSAAKVTVAEKEWGVAPAPKTAKSGKITFVAKNIGKLSHEFVVLKTSTPATKLKLKGAKAVETGFVARTPQFKPGQTKTLTLTLKAGHYVLICNLPGHYQAGQRVDFTVK